MATGDHINEYFNGRPFMVLSALALIAATTVALWMGIQPTPVESTGIFFSLKEPLITAEPLSAIVNILVLLVTGCIMLALNKVFNYVRSMTHLFVSAFYLLQLANPSGLVALHTGTLMCLVTAMMILPLFASYQDRHSQRNIFLVFAAVAAGSMFNYCFVILLPAFLLGFLNMGVFNLKGLLAMLFGLITPFWIVMGLGLATPADFVMPEINGIWQFFEQPHTNLLLILTAATAVLGIVLAVMNLLTIMNFRMQSRVYNAFFVFVLTMIIIALCIDYGIISVFLPLLNLMVAVQVAHAHTLRTSPYRYVFILLFIVGCAAFFTANLLLP